MYDQYNESSSQAPGVVMTRSFFSILIGASLWLACSWLFFHSTTFAFSNEAVGSEIYRNFFLHGMISNATLFFGMLYFFPRNEGRWSPGLLKQSLLLFASVTLVEFLVDDWVLRQIGVDPVPRLVAEIRVATIVSNLVMLGLGLFTGLVLDWFPQHRLTRQIREQQTRTELELLKSRINPHFLFNSLNSIYYLAQKNEDPDTSDAIARLSQMMRYMLDEVSEALVPLSGELEYLENFVAMQRLRLVKTIPIEFTVEGEPRGLSLPPMMLLPFVENAFKHGVSNANPTPIIIRITIDQDQLELFVENHIHPCAEQESGGFGLKNAQRRLDLLFPGRHKLEIDQNKEQYRVKLHLNIDRARNQKEISA